MPALRASSSSAPLKSTPSTCMIKLNISPPCPELKSCQICFSGLTIKLGVFSLVQGLSPRQLRPARLSWTYSPTTSSMLSRPLISSTASIGITIVRQLLLTRVADADEGDSAADEHQSGDGVDAGMKG